MKLFAQLSLILMVAVLSYQPSSFADNDLIVFPHRFGRITSRTNEAQLGKLYGERNVSRKIQQGDEGEYECVTVLFDGTDREVSISWRDQRQNYEGGDSAEEQQKCRSLAPRLTPDQVHITIRFGAQERTQMSSFWRTPDGVFAGINLLNLENINGAPIDFESSNSCFDGGIVSWNGGRLEKSKELLSSSRMYTFEPKESLEKFKNEYSIISSKNLSKSLKKSILLQNIDFYFVHEGK